MSKLKTVKSFRLARHARLRRQINGVPDRPRLAVFRSLNHIYAQVIDDSNGVTLAAASSLDLEVHDHVKDKSKTDVSKLVGELVARRAGKKGVVDVVFDRGGYKYHGRVAAVADAAREEGLKF